MIVHAVCGYRSKSDEWTEKWRDSDYRARNLIKALKGEAFNGFSEWTVRATKQTLRVDNTPQGQAVALRVALSKLFDLFAAAGISEASVVPVPSSQTVAAGATFTGSRIARGIEGVQPGLRAAPLLYFDTPQPRSHEGASRRWQDILPHLRSANLNSLAAPVVLLDDVLTSGGHLRACARYLAQRGHDVEHAFVVGRTVWQKPDEMFSLPTEILAL